MLDDKPGTYQRNLAELPPALLPLVEREQWVGWRWDDRGEKLYFLASEPQRPASLTDPSTWCDHATAVAAWQAGHADGIAYVMTEADPFAAIELVHCRHRSTRSIDIWAQNFLDAARHTYTEVTPSGDGCLILGLTDDGTDPVHQKYTVEIDGKQVVAELCRRTPKVLTVTGYRLDTVEELTSLDRAFDWAVVWGTRRTAQANGHGEPEPEPPPPSDAHEDHDSQPGAERDTSKQNILDAALDYAQRGWPVFPCRATNKAPLTKHGFKDATTDEATIRNWWGQWPGAMIGVPMGSRSGVWAVDPDPPKKPEEPDGRAVWAALVEKHGEPPKTHTEVTPRGGSHVVFKWDPARPVTNSPGALAGQNVDVRGEGGYIIVAPSVCIGDGTPKNVAGEYRAELEGYWLFAAAPDWLYELILGKPEPEPQPKRDSKSSFWRKVNDLALQNLDAWVPDVFGPLAEYQPGTGAWRVSSAALGRNLEEDLSLHPDGIKDWGVHDMGDPKRGGRTAIDIVVEYGKPKRDAATAALWLCEQMQVDPVSLGWKAGAGIIREAEDLDGGVVTQDSIARVFARRYEDRLRYCHHTGKWFEWTGAYWRKEETALAFQFCRELSREFTVYSPVKVLNAVRNISFAGGVEKFARSDRQMVATSETWDRDPFLLGTPAGTVDLRTGELREPDPRDGITKITAVAPAETADCPRWRRFLVETFGDKEPELIRFIQQWSGYCLTGDIREHALVFGFGNGKNGKSVWLTTITSIMRDYAVTAPMEAFTASKFDRHPTELAMLRGARLVTASETEKDRLWAESRIKQITGGDRISARFMRQDFFEFMPQFKLTIIGNHKPLLRNVDEATRRRFNLIPFTRTPDPDKIDRLLVEKLTPEWPGILRWMIEGCLDWQANGLQRPESVLRATESYFADQDLLAQWLDEACDTEPGNRYKHEATADLFASWTEFAKEAGEEPGSRKTFTTELSRRGFELFRAGHDNIRSFRGLRLKPS